MVRQLRPTPRTVQRAIQGLKKMKPAHREAFLRFVMMVEALPRKRRNPIYEEFFRTLVDQWRKKAPEKWGRVLRLAPKSATKKES